MRVLTAIGVLIALALLVSGLTGLQESANSPARMTPGTGEGLSASKEADGDSLSAAAEHLANARDYWVSQDDGLALSEIDQAKYLVLPFGGPTSVALYREANLLKDSITVPIATATVGLAAKRQPPRSSPSLEVKLATIQRGQPVPESDSVVRQFRSALDSLDEKCADDREHLADMTVALQGEMKRRGVSESLLDLMTHLDASIPAGTPQALGQRMNCAPVFASYATLRTGGR